MELLREVHGLVSLLKFGLHVQATIGEIVII